MAKGIFDVMAEGISRAMSRSSISSIGSVAIADNMTGRQNFTDVIKQEYVHQATMQTDDLSPMIQYVVLTGRIENLGMTEQEFYDARELNPKTLDESDRVHGEDTISYLKRKREKQKELEKERTLWLAKQARLEKTIPTWEKEIFPSWDHNKHHEQLRHLWDEGIPRSIRGKVWFLAFGNRGAITRDLYNIMAERGSKLKYLLKEHSI